METADRNTAGQGILDLRAANEWIRAASGERAKMLFGELWRTGELCVLFGEAGAGKSILAVQMADAIAKGRAVGPFAMEAGARRVLYVDLEKTAEQFAERYTHPNVRRTGRRRWHNFSKRFDRVAPADGGQVRAAEIGRLIEASGAKVVIVDSLPHMLRGGQPREAAAAMRELRRLRSAYGVSILVVTAAAARTARRGGIAAAEMAWAGAVVPMADNVFALGRCGDGGRYIKHLKPGTEDAADDGSGVVSRFRIESVDGTFPSFVHEGYGIESEMRGGGGASEREMVTERILQLSGRSYTVREIADELGVPRATVQRRLQAARAAAAVVHKPEPPPVPRKIFYELDSCIDRLCGGCDFCTGRPGHIRHKVPGTRIFGHRGCPDDCDICGPRVYRPEDTVDPELRRRSDEFFNALRAWLYGGKQGTRPVYEGARRYGHPTAAWYPGSENWPEEKLRAFDHARRKTHSDERALWEAERLFGR